MSSGLFLGIILAFGLLVWGLADLLAYLNDIETFSQWIIRRAKQSKSFAINALLILALFAMWLAFHWELPGIIWG